MSSDVRSLLHAAAVVPSIDANVGAAWRRGRRMRAQRLAVSGFAVVAVIAIASIAAVGVRSNRDVTRPAGTVTTTPGACATNDGTPKLPSWAESANPPRSLPRVLSPDGNVLAVVFGHPLRSGSSIERQNKVLWIMRLPRDGRALRITATLPGSNQRAIHVSKPADSAPGEIYPVIVDVPVPGCWHFELAWNGHRSAIDLSYAPAVAAATTSTTSTTIPSVAGDTCRTANLDITAGLPSGAAGSEYLELSFRNDSSSTCTMTGYPGVSFLDAAGHQIGVPAARNPMAYAPVTVAPGQTVYAELSAANPSVIICPEGTPRQIRVFPPNETVDARVSVAAGLRVCSNEMIGSHINPVVDRSSS